MYSKVKATVVPESGGGMSTRTLLELHWLVSGLRVAVLRVHGAPPPASVDCPLMGISDAGAAGIWETAGDVILERKIPNRKFILQT